MNHPIRRKDRALTEDQAYAILRKGEHGVLATQGEDGYPYAVPINHVVVDHIIYLHCAQEGHKLDNLAFCDRVSYCVVTQSVVLPAELSTQYESAVVFGRARRVEDPAEKRAALVAILQRFAPDFEAMGLEAIANSLNRTGVVRIDIERISGKARNKGATGD